MAVKEVLKAGGATALVAALALLTLPMSAQAQDRGGWRGQGGGNTSAQQSGGWRGGGESAGRSFRAERPAQTRAPAPQTDVQQRRASRSERGERTRWQGNAGERGERWNQRSGNAQNRAQTQAQNQRQAQNRSQAQNRRQVQNQRQAPTTPQAEAARRGWQVGNQATIQSNRQAARARDNASRQRGEDANRNQRWRGNRDNDANRDARWRDNTPNRNDRWRNDQRNQARNWNRDWRRDSRYDWRGYRNSNRGVYRLSPYHAPYRNYSYRRLTAGFFLQPLFFGSSYWIDDPWYYRLPPADGPYRWVRYYDDALLVDIYSGEVVDVIYNFFW